MWQLSEAIDGMAEACRALAIPVIGGNVKLPLYNGKVAVPRSCPPPSSALWGQSRTCKQRLPGIALHEEATTSS